LKLTIDHLLSMSITEISELSIQEQKDACILLAKKSCISNRSLIWAIIQNIHDKDKEALEEDTTFTTRMSIIAMKEIAELINQ